MNLYDFVQLFYFLFYFYLKHTARPQVFWYSNLSPQERGRESQLGSFEHDGKINKETRKASSGDITTESRPTDLEASELKTN